jgi:SAM-dependent methyltransferase
VLGRSWPGRDLHELAELERALVDGAPLVATRGGVRPDDPERTRAFLGMLARRSEGSADEVARLLAARLRPGARVVDVGGGHGRYARALAERGFEVTLLDLEAALVVARELCGDALRYRAADFLVDDLGGPYDAALLSNIVHNLGEDENVRLLERIRDVLAPGGVVAIKDLLLDDLGAHPPQAVLFGVTMLLYTDRGRVYDLAAVLDGCVARGLEVIEHLHAPDEGWSLVLARRPG